MGLGKILGLAGRRKSQQQDGLHQQQAANVEKKGGVLVEEAVEHVPDVVQDAHGKDADKDLVQDTSQDDFQDAEDGAGRSEPPWRLTGSWLQRARDELHEDPDTTPALLDALRALLREDTNLRGRCDDAFLIRFLRARKFNVAKAHKTLQRYYLMKRKHPNLFRSDNVDRLEGMMTAEMHGVLDGRDAEGCRVITVKIDNYDGSIHTVDDFFRLNVVALEQMVRDPETQVAGVNVIVDLEGFGIQHTPFLTPYYVKNTSEVIQESFPLRFKGFQVVNQPFYFAALFAIIKPFLKEKIKRRVALHGSRYTALYKTIPVDMLPFKYGGKPGGFEYERWAASVRSLAGYFSNLESYGYPEEAGGRRRLSLFSLGRVSRRQSATVDSRRQSQVSNDGKQTP